MVNGERVLLFPASALLSCVDGYCGFFPPLDGQKMFAC